METLGNNVVQTTCVEGQEDLILAILTKVLKRKN